MTDIKQVLLQNIKARKRRYKWVTYIYICDKDLRDKGRICARSVAN